MSTHGVYGYRLNGKDKVTYSQFDSYPMGWAIGLLEMIQNYSDEELVKMAENIKLVTNALPPTKEEIKACEKYTDLHVSNNSTSDWHCLLYGTQGNLEVYKDFPYMLDSSNLLKNSLVCEYAYILNLDEKVFEVYVGGNMDINAAGRYAKFSKNMAYQPDDCKYYGVALFKTIPFTEVRALLPQTLDEYMVELAKEIDIWIDKVNNIDVI